MAGQSEAFLAHVAAGLTTLASGLGHHAQGWREAMALPIMTAISTLKGVTFRADTGLTALALAQSTGLSVDNTEALGALTDAAVREDEIEAGAV